MSIYLHISLHISIYLYISLYISIYLYISLYISIYLYISLYISIYLYSVIGFFFNVLERPTEAQKFLEFRAADNFV